MDAPELAALDLLERALDVARLALLAQHVHLLDPAAPPWVDRGPPRPGEAAAAAFFDRVHYLRVVLRRYREEVEAADDARQSKGTDSLDDF